MSSPVESEAFLPLKDELIIANLTSPNYRRLIWNFGHQPPNSTVGQPNISLNVNIC